jgi:predicted MFS family arabinose efflux permease
MMIAVIFIPFFAQNIQTLFAGQLLAGIPWGIFQTLTTAVSLTSLLRERQLTRSTHPR